MYIRGFAPSGATPTTSPELSLLEHRLLSTPPNVPKITDVSTGDQGQSEQTNTSGAQGSDQTPLSAALSNPWYIAGGSLVLAALTALTVVVIVKAKRAQGGSKKSSKKSKRR